MFVLFSRLSLPLVVKELLEQSARRRTYIIRVVYASLFFLACLLMILQQMPRGGSSPFGVLGIGHLMFVSIAGWQFAGIYLFLPALACNVLTVEKERNTLGLLFLTKLGPWTIIIEKLLSRLLPMYCLILCSLPLLAFSMSFGGVNTSDFFTAVWFLSLTAFQICAIAVACSSVFRTTTGALLMCYLSMFLVGFGIPISDWLILDRGISNFLRHAFGLTQPYDKIAGVRRVAWVCAIPLITSITFESWWVETAGMSRHRYGYQHLWWDGYLTKISMVAIYIPLLIWLGLWIGLKIKSPTRATSAALITVVGWCVLPLLFVTAAWELFGGGNLMTNFGMALQFSPAFLLVFIQFDSLRRLAPVPLLPMIFNVLIYGSCVILLRSWVLNSADQLLGRTLPRQRPINWNDWDAEAEEPVA